MKRAEKKLLEVLRASSAIVGYEPLGDEPQFDEYLRKTQITLPVYRISPDKNSPPEHAMSEVSVIAGGGDALIFLPGRAFDTLGTRHGRGGGWYDRFLSMVPQKWTRVGVAVSTNISDETLDRKPWDEPVDYLLIKNPDGWEVIETPRGLRKT